MARVNSLVADNLSGQVGKQLVYRQFGNKTIVSRYPDMSGIKPSELQKEKRSRFAEAVAYARGIINNPSKKAAYQKKVKKGQQVYHYALQEYLAQKP